MIRLNRFVVGTPKYLFFLALGLNLQSCVKEKTASEQEQERLVRLYKEKARPNEGLKEFEGRIYMSSKEHLDKAKEFMSKYKNWKDAKSHLTAIDEGTQEYPEAKKLLRQVEDNLERMYQENEKESARNSELGLTSV